MFALTFLGTSASVPSAERNHPSLLVEAGSQRILVDCGEGTQRQLLRGGVGFRRLDRLLLTHGHFDHVLGIPGLFSTLRLRRSADLMSIHGSPGTLDVVIRMLAGLDMIIEIHACSSIILGNTEGLRADLGQRTYGVWRAADPNGSGSKIGIGE